MKLLETQTMIRPVRFNVGFTWNYVAQKILGKQVRRKVQLQASSSRRLRSSNIHDKPVSSWCNTALAPPVVTTKAGEAMT